MPDEIQKEEIRQTATEVSTSTLFEATKKVVAELKIENDRHDAFLKEQRELEARRLLGGHTDAGIQPIKPAELSPKEYASQVIKGIIPVQ